MSSLSGAIPFPATKDGTRGRTRVDHRNSDEAALVRRVQARDEMAFREILERYQAKVFSIIYGILRTSDAATSAPALGLTFLLFLAIYVALAVTSARLLLLLASRERRR